jgi:hypothetical protein
MPDAHPPRGQPTKFWSVFDAWRDGTGTITDVFAPEMVWRIEVWHLKPNSTGEQQHERINRRASRVDLARLC